MEVVGRIYFVFLIKEVKREFSVLLNYKGYLVNVLEEVISILVKNKVSYLLYIIFYDWFFIYWVNVFVSCWDIERSFVKCLSFFVRG